MRKLLVTGGTVFVSKFIARYFVNLGDDVYVLNRNNREQVKGVTLIEGDRHQLGNKLKNETFDAIIDVTAYTGQDVKDLVEALGTIKDYIFISSSAVYPETLPQPFHEEQSCGANAIWGDYGVNKLAAEQYLATQVPQAYILRPPYLYGPMENVYREPFVFDCANAGRPFCIPKDGTLPLQFFHVEDLCRFIDLLLQKHPYHKIYNVGNEKTVDINEWVGTCYQAAGRPLEKVYVSAEHPQRSYFPFYDYAYYLDVSRQAQIMPTTKPLLTGLKESYDWYMEHSTDVVRKPFFEYIEAHHLYK